MSLLTTLAKNVAPKVTNLAKGLAAKATPYINNAKSNLSSGAKTYADNFAKRDISSNPSQGKIAGMTLDPTGTMAAPAKMLSGLASKTAPRLSASLSSGFDSASRGFAEKMANVSTKYADQIKTGGTKIPTRNPSPIKSGSVDQRTFSDIRPTKPTVTTKTNTARNSTLDTRTTPTKVGTTKTPPPPKSFPYAKTALGLGAAGLGINALMPGEQTAAEPTMPTYDGANFAAPIGAEQTTQNTDTTALSPDAVFGGGNNEGGVFESPTPAPQTGTAMGGSFQPSFAASSFSGGTAGGGGIGSGVSGAGGSQYTAATDSYIGSNDKKKKKYRTDEEDAQRKAFRLANTKDKETDTSKSDKIIEDYNRRIADLMNRQSKYDIDLEGSAASSSAREGLSTMFDRETRKSLIPLQTSLALVQAERDRMDKLRQQEFDNDLALNPVGTEDKAFTLGAGQTRFALNPQTGQYEAVGSVDSKADSPNEAPTSIQEYQYAQQQGYTGTFNDFKNQSSSNAQTGDKILSPTEAASLGVPYGTTQAQAYGQNPSKMSGDAAKVSAIASTMIPEINTLKQRFTQNYKGALTGLLTGTDRELVKLVDQIADKVGRLRSGGAVNADEEARFKRQIASFMDLPFGNGQQAIEALDGLINEAQQVSSSVNPYYSGNNYQQTDTQSTSGWNW